MRFTLVGLGGIVGLLGIASAGCGASTGPRPADAPPPMTEAPGGSGATAPASATAIAFAAAQVGKPYCWGGTGPRCFDCSGLVQTAWRAAHVDVPRTSEAQGRLLLEVPRGEMRPGDILWWPHHVGIYVGGGQMIDAYHTGAGVVRRPVTPPPSRVLRAAPRRG